MVEMAGHRNQSNQAETVQVTYKWLAKASVVELDDAAKYCGGGGLGSVRDIEFLDDAVDVIACVFSLMPKTFPISFHRGAFCMQIACDHTVFWLTLKYAV